MQAGAFREYVLRYLALQAQCADVIPDLLLDILHSIQFPRTLLKTILVISRGQRKGNCVSAEKKTSGPVKFMAVFLGVCVVFYIVRSISYSSEHPNGEPAPVRDKCESNAFAYLLALKEGNSIASAYWKPGVTPQTLFDVRDFHDIKHGPFVQLNGKPYKIPRVYYEYEVESSTKGGFPIRKRWGVIMEPSAKGFGGDPCPVVQLTEMQ
jgi:hypothetical protein